jgi:hypothetical protein
VTLSANRLHTKYDLNIIPLSSYDYLIGMDCLNEHNVILDYYNNTFYCLDEEGNLRIVQGILRVVTIKEVSNLQLKKSYQKGCQFLQLIWKRNIRIKCQVLKIS